ncbi:MAG: cysteine desulfurase family protein [Chlamydiales bacterium]
MRIYLDNNATTPLDPEVRQAMVEELATPPSNPSSVHFFGQEARKRLSKARQTIAEVLGVRSSQIIFTSGATEGVNMLLRGFFSTHGKGHIISSDIEHSSVYNTLLALEKQGATVTLLPAQEKGFITPEAVAQAVRSDTRLVVLGAVNSETGIKNPIAEIAALCEARSIPFVVDGVALLGKESFTIPPGVSALAFSAHKFHGPKGVGFNFIRTSFPCQPLHTGGDQEYTRRAGTENLPGIIGLAKAVELFSLRLPASEIEMRTLRDHFEKALQTHISDLIVHGKNSPRACNTSCLAFPGVDGETLLLKLDMAGVCASHGSACAAGALEPSRVLLNMGLSPIIARSTLRFSLSRMTTQDEIDRAVEILKQVMN